MASKVTIYSTNTPGVSIERHQIDANECVQRGGWSFSPVAVAPVVEVAEPVVIAPVVVEEVAAEPAPLSVPQKGKPGRKPKSA